MWTNILHTRLREWFSIGSYRENAESITSGSENKQVFQEGDSNLTEV